MAFDEETHGLPQTPALRALSFGLSMAECSRVSKKWRRMSRQHRSLWWMLGAAKEQTVKRTTHRTKGVQVSFRRCSPEPRQGSTDSIITP